MLRCTVCQCPSDSAICPACHGLLTKPDHGCQTCGKPLTASDAPSCGECLSDPPAFDAVIYASLYQAPMDHWVHQLKFGGQLSSARLMAEALFPELQNLAHDIPIIPVPLHPKRLRKRGYNQASEIAKIIGKMQNRPILDHILIRNKATQMQAELREKQRAANVASAFQCKQAIDHEHVLLLDDVMTTGQTLRASAKTLKKAGVQRVTAVVFVRSKG